MINISKVHRDRVLYLKYKFKEKGTLYNIKNLIILFKLFNKNGLYSEAENLYKEIYDEKIIENIREFKYLSENLNRTYTYEEENLEETLKRSISSSYDSYNDKFYENEIVDDPIEKLEKIEKFIIFDSRAIDVLKERYELKFSNDPYNMKKIKRIIYRLDSSNLYSEVKDMYKELLEKDIIISLQEYSLDEIVVDSKIKELVEAFNFSSILWNRIRETSLLNRFNCYN